MQRTLIMASWILLALVLPIFIHGRPATDDGRSLFGTLTALAPQLENYSGREQKAISSFAHGSPLVSAKLRVGRSSDHRLSELKTLETVSKITNKRSPLTTGNKLLDPVIIGRRRRFATNEVPIAAGPLHQ